MDGQALFAAEVDAARNFKILKDDRTKKQGCTFHCVLLRIGQQGVRRIRIDQLPIGAPDQFGVIRGSKPVVPAGGRLTSRSR
jgi:hypothetical protein